MKKSEEFEKWESVKSVNLKYSSMSISCFDPSDDAHWTDFWYNDASRTLWIWIKDHWEKWHKDEKFLEERKSNSDK